VISSSSFVIANTIITWDLETNLGFR
jgi:hypothetical protein